jgi:hypothetical protein
MLNVDLRDDITAAQNCLLLSGDTQRLNVRTNGKFDQSLYSVLENTPIFGSRVTIDLSQGTSFVILARNSSAFIVENPLHTSAGTRFTVQIWNTSPGALGAVSWDSQYKVAAVLPPPSGTHISIEFETNGNNSAHYEINRTPYSVPN